MTALMTSNRLLGFNSPAPRSGRPAKNETPPPNAYWRIELRRSLSVGKTRAAQFTKTKMQLLPGQGAQPNVHQFHGRWRKFHWRSSARGDRLRSGPGCIRCGEKAFARAILRICALTEGCETCITYAARRAPP